MQICTLTQTHNHASIPPLSFLQAGCLSCCPTNSVKALKINFKTAHLLKRISIILPLLLPLLLLWLFVWDYLGEPVPEETFTHSHPSWSSITLYQLSPSTMIHSILPVQFKCLTVFLHSLSPSFLWSTSWPGTLHFILHIFLHPIIVFFSQHMPIATQHVL